MNTYSNHHYLNVLGQLNLDELNIQQAFDYYRKRYLQSKLAQEFVSNSALIDADVKNTTYVGFCDRTLGKQIPKTKTYDGAAIRGSLQRSGLVRASGHELFRGCVVFLTYDDNDRVISAVGYRVGRIRHGDKAIVNWHRPEPKAFVDIGMSFAKELIHGKTHH